MASYVIGPQYRATAAYLRGVDSGDLDDDGDRDLVMGGTTNGNVDVFLNDGAGGFARHGPYGDGGNGGKLFLGDLDGDGRLDYVHDASTVVVRLGSGAGTFGEATPSVVMTPHALADVDDDGVLDLEGAIPGSVVIALGHGDGSFGAVISSPLPAGVTISDIAVGDFDEDGRVDLFITDGTPGGSPIIMPGLGAGRFAAAVTIPYGSSTEAVSVADINRDANLDAVVARETNGGFSLSLLGDGNGTLEIVQSVPNDGGGRDIELVDVDSDGSLDFVTTLRVADGIAVRLGLGDGTFGAPWVEPTVVRPSTLELGDFTGDGVVDIVVLGSDSNLWTLHSSEP